MCVSGSDTYLLSLCIYVASRNMCVGRADTYLKSVGLHAEVLNKGVSYADTCLNWRCTIAQSFFINAKLANILSI